MNGIAKAMTKVFWGMLLVFLSFKINHFDLLPDFIGYFIVASAMNDLVSFSHTFSKAKKVAIILAIVSIPAMFMREISLSEGFEPSSDVFTLLLGSTAIQLLALIFIYFLFQGLIELASKYHFNELAKKTKKILTACIIIDLLVLSLTPFSMNLPGTDFFLFIIIGIITSFIVSIVILVLFRTYRKQFLSIE
ncbi:hypothetical protein [Bacillus niameyensis]|uniref:hypothetical protein n=1 Tax=Bacillus niameyensis TaxID=1522308 RepID=UPI000781D4A7|nr:hypothetical protein [Bacillus niameyensis]